MNLKEFKMNFDFKKSEQVPSEILEKKSIIPKFNNFKLFPRGFNMNFSLSRIHPGFWSILTLTLGVIAMHYKVENAVWVLPIGCMLYYAANHVVPFAVMLVALAGMFLGIPQLAFLLFFAIITMINWSGVSI